MENSENSLLSALHCYHCDNQFGRTLPSDVSDAQINRRWVGHFEATFGDEGVD